MKDDRPVCGIWTLTEDGVWVILDDRTKHLRRYSKGKLPEPSRETIELITPKLRCVS